MSANLKYGARERQRKREKGRQRSRERDKNKGDIFLLEEQHENFVAAVTMLAMVENERQ